MMSLRQSGPTSRKIELASTLAKGSLGSQEFQDYLKAARMKPYGQLVRASPPRGIVVANDVDALDAARNRVGERRQTVSSPCRPNTKPSGSVDRQAILDAFDDGVA